MCKIFQQFKNRKTIYERLPPISISELKPWDTLDLDLIGPYSKSIRQHHQGGAIINNNISLTCMMIIDPGTGWFEIFEVMTFDLYEVTGGNDDYIYNSSCRVRQLFNNIWLCRYSYPRKVVFDKISDFKRYFTPFTKGFQY